jgi:hypothetical protein
MNADSRIAELQALALAENITLPYPVDYILFLEDSGRIVDLATGEVIYAGVVATPTASAQAVAYLLAGMDGDVLLNSL